MWREGEGYEGEEGKKGLRANGVKEMEVRLSKRREKSGGVSFSVRKSRGRRGKG